MVKSRGIRNAILVLLTVAALFGVYGCTIGGEFYEKMPHTTEGQGKIPKHLVIVNSYNTIKHEIREVVAEGKSGQKFAVTDYWGDLDSDIKSIIKEITTVDAIGNYAVSSIMYEQAKAVGFQQLSVSIEYKKTPLEIKSIVNTLDDRDFEAKLSDMFSVFDTQRTFKVITAKTDEELYDQVLKGYYMSSGTAFGLKTVKISPVKDTIFQQVLEIEVAYIWEKDKLVRMKETLESAVRKLCQPYKLSTHDEKMAFIANYLRTNVALNAEAMRVVKETGNIQPKFTVYSAYGALIDKDASQSGTALAAKRMCEVLGVDSRLIVGEKDGASHMWLMVKNGEIWQHCDVSDGTERYIIPQGEIAANYKYNARLYPME